MPQSLDTIPNLFEQGRFAELVRLIDSSPNSLDKLDIDNRILFSHALALSGDLDRSRDALADIPIDQCSAVQRSQFELTSGIVRESSGHFPEALAHFQAAVHHAAISHDDYQIAWAQLRLFRHLIDTNTTDNAIAVLPGLRRIVIRAGHPFLSTYLHECVSVVEGQLGRTAEAARHCTIADSLLAVRPNDWLQGGNLMNRACLAILDCEFADAARYLANARRILNRSGARFSAGEVNLAHCQIVAGELDKAKETLDAVLSSRRASRFAVLAAIEGLGRIQLASNNVDSCLQALSRLRERRRSSSHLANAFYVRWAIVTEARLLMKLARPREAVDVLTDAENHSSERDLPLRAAIHVTMADALVRCGDLHGAAVRLLQADRHGVTAAPELRGVFYFTAATSVANSDPALAEQLRRRALLLWKHFGLASVPRELAPADAPHSASSVSSDALPTGEPDLACALDALAAAFDLADTPELLGMTLLDVLHMTEAAPQASLHTGRVKGPKSDCLILPLETGAAPEKFLISPIPLNPRKALLLAATAKVADAALELQRFRTEEKQRAALWPAEPPEEQEGAVYLAEEMQALLAIARRVAATDVPVLITGETGTGKEILARTIHAYSPRPKAPFVPFNCTAMPRDMLDSQLFGHRRGAFTGATDNFPGVIRSAAGGTLLLDEIGDMPLELQPKLLRFLESGEIHPVGEAQPVRVDVRVVAATNADLDADVTDGRFREDLFYRLNIVRLHVPPLRERRVEIPTLANHYLQKFAREYKKGDLRLAEETMEYLVLYRWPGNVRQLANEIRRMAALCESGAVLMPEHLAPEIAASRRTLPPSERALDATEMVVRLDQPMAAAVEHVERAMLQYALKQCGGRMEETAALLGLSRKGLYLKRQRLGIEPPEMTGAAVIA